MPAFSPLPTWSFVLGVTASLFSVINPPSASMLFATATAGMDTPSLRRAARKACLTATVTLVLFALVGQFIFTFFGFTALAMRFVGGVLVLYRAISMLYGEDPRERSTDQERAEAALKLDSAKPSMPVVEFMRGENRFRKIMESDSSRAATILAHAQDYADRRYAKLFAQSQLLG